MDRTEINRTLSKAMAYKQCGQETQARAWGIKLITLLEMADIIDPAWMED